MTTQTQFADLRKLLEGISREEATKGSVESMEVNDGCALSSGSLQEPQEQEEKFEEFIRGLNEEFRNLKSKNSELKTSMRDVLAENATLREVVRRERKKNTALRQAYRKGEEERLAAQRLLNKERERQETMRDAIRKAWSGTDALRRQLSTKDLEIEAMKRELHAKSLEPSKVTGLPQGYQAKVAMEADVCSLMTTLNTEIKETCMAIVHSESFAFARQPMGNTDDGHRTSMSEHFGNCSVMEWLCDQTSTINPLALEIALRVALVAISSWIISEWNPNLEGIEPIEIQTTAFSDDTVDPWGRVVHLFARGFPCNALRYTLGRSISKALVWVVMKCAGYVSDDAIVCEFALKAYEQLSKIIDLALQLHAVLKKGGVKELWLLQGVPGYTFDSSEMIDGFRDPEGDDQIDDIMLGTTALGLCRIVIDPTIYAAELRFVPLMKEEVVLASFLDGLQQNDEDSDEDSDESTTTGASD